MLYYVILNATQALHRLVRDETQSEAIYWFWMTAGGRQCWREVEWLFEQGMSKERFCTAAGPLEYGHRHLGYTYHLGSSLLPWVTFINPEALETRMGAIILSWEG